MLKLAIRKVAGALCRFMAGAQGQNVGKRLSRLRFMVKSGRISLQFLLGEQGYWNSTFAISAEK
jgi:hypothetical protein